MTRNIKKVFCTILFALILICYACSLSFLGGEQVVLATNTEKTVWNNQADISGVDSTKKLIAFTFDDGSNTSTFIDPNMTVNGNTFAFSTSNMTYNEVIRKIFNDFNETQTLNASATFFNIGSRLPANNTATLATYNDGHEIGNHSNSHSYFTDMTGTAIQTDLSTMSGKIDTALSTSNGSYIVRAPYGAVTDEVKANINYPIIQWSSTLASLDTNESTTAQDIYNTILNNAFDGGIVLMHETQAKSFLAVQELLPALYQNGYQVVSVSQMFKARGVPLYTNTVYSNCTVPSAIAQTVSLGAGWNLGNTFDRMTTVDNYETLRSTPLTTQAMLNAVAEKGFSSVRLTCSWEYHMQVSSTNTTTATSSFDTAVIKSSYISRIKEVVDYSLNAGLKVVLNYHHPYNGTSGVLTSTDPVSSNLTYAQAVIENIWTQIAEYFAEYDNRLMFEVLNEPRDRANADWLGDSSKYAALNTLNQKAVDTIRNTGKANYNRLIILPVYAQTASVSAMQGFTMPANDDSLAVAIHAYLPDGFAFKDSGNTYTTVFDADGKAEVDDYFESVNQYLTSKGYAVVVTETGAKDKNNNDEREKWAKYFTESAANYGISCMIWDNHCFTAEYEGEEIFGLFNRNTLTWTGSIADEFVEGAKALTGKDNELLAFRFGTMYGATAGETNSIVSDDDKNWDVWQVSGWGNSRIVLESSLDLTTALNSSGYLYFDYKIDSSEASAYTTLSLGNANGYSGDIKKTEPNAITLTKDSTWHTFEISLSAINTALATSSCWGAAVSGTIDFSCINAIVINSNATIKIDNIYVNWVQTSQSDDGEVVDITFLSSGTAQGTLGGVTNSLVADSGTDNRAYNVWSVQGWGNSRIVLSSSVDISNASVGTKLMFDYKIATTQSSAYITYGLGNAYGTQGDIQKTSYAVTLIKDGAWHTFCVSLSSLSYTLTSSTCWGTSGITGDLDKTAVNSVLFNANGTVFFDNIKIESYEDISLSIEGSSIRLNENSGLRVLSKISKADLTSLENNSAVESFSIGTLMIPTANLGSGTLLISTSNVLDIQKNLYYSETDDDYYFTGVLTQVPSTDYETQITVRSYITVNYADNTSYTFYTDAISVSVADVAELAYEDRQVTQSESYYYLTADGDYSPYTQTQLELLFDFFN